MLDLGKKLFRNNVIQLTFIIVCSILVLLAHKLSFHAIHLSLNQYISGNSIHYFLTKENFSFIINVIIPSIAFILSLLLFIWISITNFLLFNDELEKIDGILRLTLGIIQTIFLGLLLYKGGIIFFYFLLFLLIVVVIGGHIFSGLTLNDR